MAGQEYISVIKVQKTLGNMKANKLVDQELYFYIF